MENTNTKLTQMETITIVDSLMEYSGMDNDSLHQNVITPLIQKLVYTPQTKLTHTETLTSIDSLMEYDGRDNESLNENIITPLIDKLTQLLIG